MNFTLKIARRYMLAKRSTNAIHVITGIAVFGIAVGAAALILVLSVFNGFEDLIVGMYSHFNPDVKITPVQGKSFPVDSTVLARLQRVPGVDYLSQTLEEVAVFQYKDNQDFGIIKGVDGNYHHVTNIDSVVREGYYQLRDGDLFMAVLGLGMRNNLGVNVEDHFSSIAVYMPKRKEVRNPLLEKPFVTQYLVPAGTFLAQQEFDQEYVITDLAFTQRLLSLPDEISAIEIKLSPGFGTPATFAAIREVMGPDFVVRNRYEQQESFFKLMKMEKWLSYAIAGLMMFLVSFNMVGALWMVVLEKKTDISILKSMGANDGTVRNIFLTEGLLLSLVGLLLGFFLAVTLYVLQKTVGIITIPGNASIDAYPISMRFSDFAVVSLTVLAIGILASLAPAIRAMRVPALIREE